MLSLALIVALRPVPDLLERVRTALSVSTPAWSQTHLGGKATYFGEPHEYTLDFDRGGEFIQRFKGPIGETFGYDGTTFWMIDPSRAVQKLDFEDKDRELVTGLLLSSAWIAHGAPVTITQKDYTLQLTLKSGMTETIAIDPATSLPVEARFPISSGDLVFRLGKWRAAGNRRVPTHIEVTDGGITDTIDASTVEEGGAMDWAMPAWKPDIAFDPAKASRLEAKKAISGHILVHPLINGEDAGWFILDSGAEITVLDSSTADKLKLAKVGRNPLTGVGGTVQSTFRPVSSLTLGPATLSNILCCDLDLSQIGALLGVRLGGVLGADLFKRAIVSIDLNAPSVDLFAREGYALPNAKWMPIRFSTGNPAVQATVAGAPTSWFRFDTGANGTATLHAPFVRKYDLLKGVKTTDAGQGGVGGLITVKSGHVKWFELGGRRFEDPTVIFATSDKGAFGDRYLAGNIGHDFMSPFRIVLDFSGYRLALIPR